MLYSLYAEIEKFLKLMARELDGRLPASNAGHKELLLYKAIGTDQRPAVLPESLVTVEKDTDEVGQWDQRYRSRSIAAIVRGLLRP